MAQLVPGLLRFSVSGGVLAPTLVTMMVVSCGGQTVPVDGDLGVGIVGGMDATVDVGDSGGTGYEYPGDAGSGEGSAREAGAGAEAGGEGGLIPAEGGIDAGEDAPSPDAARDAASDSGSTGADVSVDAPAEGSTPACSPSCPDGAGCVSMNDCASGVCANGICSTPACSPGCADGLACGEARDCASSSCVNGTCAPSVPCGTTCTPGATCISEAVPVTNEGQSCPITCSGGSDIATITTVYATNCNPTPCPSAVNTCAGQTSCDAVLDNTICGGDPCPDVPKGWSVTVTCH
jgi:hypothetical protein